MLLTQHRNTDSNLTPKPKRHSDFFGNKIHPLSKTLAIHDLQISAYFTGDAKPVQKSENFKWRAHVEVRGWLKRKNKTT